MSSITIKTAEDIAGMREACRLASEVLDYIAPHIKPGITTLEIDRLGKECMDKQGTVSATIGYQPPGYHPTPVTCAPRSITWSATAFRTTSR